jgi:RHS repeat-associated protein
VSQTTGSNIDSNDIVGKTQFPDPTTGAPSSSQQETATANALGQALTQTDRNGNVHTLSYDVLGRVVSDAATTLGTVVDGSVRRIDTAYDGQGNPYLITSYNAVSGGSIVNQVQQVYNGLDQMTAEYQSHSGAVNTSTTPSVQYAYTEMSGGVDNSRLTSITYPDGYVLTYNYSSGLNSTISRLSSLSDSSGTLESYKFLGLDTVVERDHPQTNVNQTYITGGTGDAGDQYAGLDRFGRVVDDLWTNTSTTTTTDEFQYGYDQASNVLYRNNTVNTAFGELYTYDVLNQLATFQRGTLNSTKTGLTGSASASQSFSTDAVGNFTSVTTNGTTQTRTANAQNQYTSISGATTPTYDANGNMTKDETGRQFVYDAWNRLVTVKNSGGTTLESFSYDGLDRRVTQTASGTTTDLFYSDQDQVLEEMQSGATTVRYVWSPVYVNAMVLRDRATGSPGTLNERLWVQQDANWNVTALVNSSGVVVERYVYSPYGVVTIYDPSYTTVRSSSSYAANYLFQGMRYDSISGLYEADERWYSATQQRWISLDPIRFAAGDVNFYRLEGNSPIAGVDPSGLLKIESITINDKGEGEVYKLRKLDPSKAGNKADQSIQNAMKTLGSNASAEGLFYSFEVTIKATGCGNIADATISQQVTGFRHLQTLVGKNAFDVYRRIGSDTKGVAVPSNEDAFKDGAKLFTDNKIADLEKMLGQDGPNRTGKDGGFVADQEKLHYSVSMTKDTLIYSDSVGIPRGPQFAGEVFEDYALFRITAKGDENAAPVVAQFVLIQKGLSAQKDGKLTWTFQAGSPTVSEKFPKTWKAQ